MNLDSKPVCWVVMPVYNEAAGIIPWMQQIEIALPDQNLFFVLSDDGSTDDLNGILKRQTTRNNFTVLGDGVNRGPGAAFERAFSYVLQHGKIGDTVITIEADGTADLSSLRVMHEKLKNFEVVLASVYLPGGGFTKTNAFRLLLSHAANALTRGILRLPFRTLTSFYRAYRFDAIRTLYAHYNPLIVETGFICQVELLWKTKQCRLRIVEVATRVYSEKRIGNSKMKIWRTMKEYLLFLMKMLIQRTNSMKQ
jgi:dolichol-phosphate mannosyltransferase